MIFYRSTPRHPNSTLWKFRLFGRTGMAYTKIVAISEWFRAVRSGAKSAATNRDI